jgi:hypothetical protein
VRKEVGCTKGLELAKVAKGDGQEFDCATWLHKARSLPKEEFKREVEKELTGRESEPWEIIYFKLYKTPIEVVEQAIETAALILRTDKSGGYCLEMICADFLAGANLENEDPTVLLQYMSRFFKFLPGEQRQAFRRQVTEKARETDSTQATALVVRSRNLQLATETSTAPRSKGMPSLSFRICKSTTRNRAAGDPFQFASSLGTNLSCPLKLRIATPAD